MKNLKLNLAPILAAVCIALAAHGAASAATIRVFAAASLTDAFKRIAAAYQQAHPGDTVQFSFTGSQLLEQQLEQGAPADVFASADTKYMDLAVAHSLTMPSTVFAHNSLVVAATADNNAVETLADLAKSRVKVVIAGDKVPAGHYALTALNNLSAVYGASYVSQVEANVVSREVNVRDVLTKVMLGQADAGIVYITDAKQAAASVRTIGIPARYNVVATYPIAALKGSHETAAAAAFVAFVTGPQGQAILQSYGFQK